MCQATFCLLVSWFPDGKFTEPMQLFVNFTRVFEFIYKLPIYFTTYFGKLSGRHTCMYSH